VWTKKNCKACEAMPRKRKKSSLTWTTCESLEQHASCPAPRPTTACNRIGRGPRPL